MSCKDCFKNNPGKVFLGASHALVAAAKYLTRTGLSETEVIRQRQSICRECPHATPHPTRPGRKSKCDLCGCYLTLKTKIANESCPIGKWGSVVEEE